ncbi:MAG: hypothetical protein Q9209_000434 [Squamulea sp. 1 TL-2023]
MDHLPPEIITNICSHVCSDDDSSLTRTVDLKSLRLCCRSFAGPAADLLFVEVLLFMDLNSLRKLNAIAGHPVYRNKVQSVGVFVRMISKNLVVKDDYEHAVRDIKMVGPSGEMWDFNEEGERSLSQEAVEQGYKDYMAFLDEQTEAFSVARVQLSRAIKNFKKITSVVAISFHYCLDTEGIVQTQPSKINTIARKTLMPRDGRLWISIPYPSEDAKLIWEAVAESQCSVQELCLAVGMYPFSFKMLEVSGLELGRLRESIKSVQKLTIVMGAGEDFTAYYDELPSFGFLDHAPKLQVLLLRACSFDVHTSFFVGTVYWPHLREMILHGLCSSERQLRSIFRSVQSTLKYLGLVEIALSAGSWYGVLLELKGFGLDASSIDVFNPYCFDHEVFYGIDDNHGVTDAQLALIKDFVCNGKSWSKYLPEFLSWQF